MGRRLVRAREAVRRMFGKPGRRKGVEQRLGLEVPDGPGGFSYDGFNQKVKLEKRRLTLVSGKDKRKGAERRKK